MGTKDIRLGSRRFRTAKARRISKNVYTVEIPDNAVLSWLSYYIPKPIRSRLLPSEWFLPSTIVIKEPNYNIPNCIGRIEHEREMYRQHPRLQEGSIPYFFGNAISDGCPAIALEYVAGVPLNELSPEKLGGPELRMALQSTYKEFTKEDLLHGDPRLHNFLWLEPTKVIAVDLESSSKLSNDIITNEHEFETIKDQIDKAIGKLDPDF